MTRPLRSVVLAAVITLIAWMTAAIPTAHAAPAQAQDYAARAAHVLKARENTVHRRVEYALLRS